MEFLTNCEGNKDEVKRLIGTLLWNFSRRQPPRSDSEWMVLWRDLCTLQEKAFPFLEKEYLLEELCRGLLQAGKYSLANNYLAGTGSMYLPPEKAEAVVLETAREFFYSAPSLDSSAVSITSFVEIFGKIGLVTRASVAGHFTFKVQGFPLTILGLCCAPIHREL